jgi:hypothetical protein
MHLLSRRPTRIASLLLIAACSGESDAPPGDTGEAADTAAADDSGADTASNGELTCATEACGGEPTGAWTISETCFLQDWFEVEDCPGWEGRLTGVEVTGTLQLNADGRYAAELATIDWTLEVVIPAACLEGETCADKEASSDGTTCLDDGSGGCLCSGAQSFPGLAAEGDWTAEAASLSLDPDAGDAAESGYCADADQLWLDLTENFFLPIQLLYSRN